MKNTHIFIQISHEITFKLSSYRLIAFLLFRPPLVVLLMCLESSGVNNIQALRPLPVESTQLLFAVGEKKKKKKSLVGFNFRALTEQKNIGVFPLR